MTAPPSSPRANAGLLTHAAQGVMGWAVPLGVTFFTTPLIVHGLGPDGFAVYAWAAAFATAISASGPARGVLHLVSRTGVARLRQDAVATGLWAVVTLGLVAAGLLWALASAAASMAHLPAGSAIPAMRIAVIGAVPVAAMAVCVGALQGLRRFGAAAMLTSVAGAVAAAGAAWMATSGWGVTAVLSWQAAAALVVAAVGLFVLRSDVGPVWGRPTRTATAGLARFGMATIGTQVMFATWIVVERTLVGRYLGPHVLTALVVALLLWMHASAALVSAVQVVASLAPADGAGPDDRLARVYPSATVMTAVVAVGFTSIIAGLGVPALTLWIGRDVATIVGGLLLPLALGLGLNSLGTTAWFANEAEGRPSRNTLWAATGLVLNAVTLLWLAPGGHIVAPGIARLVAVAPGPLFIAWTERSSRGRLQAPWRALLAYVVPCGILLFAGLRAAEAVAASSWFALIAAAASGIALYAVVVWHLPVLTDRDRLVLRTWIKALVDSGARRATLRE